MAEPALMDLVSNLPLLDDLFDEAPVLEVGDESNHMCLDPNLRMDVSDPYKVEYGQRSLSDLVGSLPWLDDLFEEDSVPQEVDYSVSMLRQHAPIGHDDRQAKTERRERLPADVVGDLAELEDMFGQDSFPEEMDDPTFVPSQPVPCVTKRDGQTGHWDDDEAYFSSNSDSEEQCWRAAHEPA